MVSRTFCSEELAGDVEGFAADDDDLLAVEELFGDNAGQAAEQMALAIYHDLSEHTPLVLRLLLCTSLDQQMVRPTTGSNEDILTECWRESRRCCWTLRRCKVGGYQVLVPS